MSEMSSDSKRGNPSIGAYENPYPFYVWTPVCDDIEGYETLQEAIAAAESYGDVHPREYAPHYVLELRHFIARSSSEDAIEEAKAKSLIPSPLSTWTNQA
jgi:hypothetical protein